MDRYGGYVVSDALPHYDRLMERADIRHDLTAALDMLDRCEAMLHRLEWTDFRALTDGSGWDGHCPVCDSPANSQTHHRSCDLAALLADLGGDDE